MKRKRHIRTLIHILMAAAIAFFVYTTVAHGFDSKSLFGMLAVVIGGAVAILRMNPKPKQPLPWYEKKYAAEIGSAFTHTPYLRSGMLLAVGFSDDGEHLIALKHLEVLRERAQTDADFRAVLFFAAISLAAIGETDTAIHVYQQYLQFSPTLEQRIGIYRRLAELYTKLGDPEEAQSYIDGIEALEQTVKKGKMA